MKQKILPLIVLLASLGLAFTFGPPGSPFETGESVTAANMNEIDAGFDALEAADAAFTALGADVTAVGAGATSGDGGVACTGGACFDGITAGNKLSSLDDFIILLDANNNGTNLFKIENYIGATALSVSENGSLIASGSGSFAGTLTVGQQAAARGTMVLWGGDSGVNNLWSYTFGAPTTGGANVTFLLPPTNGVSGNVIQTNGSGVTSWYDIAAGIVSGVALKSTAATTVDNALPKFSGAAGDIQPSLVIVDSSDNLTTPGSITSTPGLDGTNGLTLVQNTSNVGAPVTEGQCRVGFVGTELMKMCNGQALMALEPSVVVTTGAGPVSPQAIGEMQILTNTGDVVYNLPAAVAGLSACFYDNSGGADTGGISVDVADGTDKFLLNGTALTLGNRISSPGIAGTSANGDMICVMAIDGTSWITTQRSGTWVDGGA